MVVAGAILAAYDRIVVGGVLPQGRPSVPTDRSLGTGPVIVRALAAPVTSGSVPAVRLSPREQEVLELVAEGYSNAMIATRLHLSENTVKDLCREPAEPAQCTQSRGGGRGRLPAESDLADLPSPFSLPRLESPATSFHYPGGYRHGGPHVGCHQWGCQSTWGARRWRPGWWGVSSWSPSSCVCCWPGRDAGAGRSG